MTSRSQPLYIGVGGHAVAIDPSTGAELWRTRLKSSQFVTVMASAGRLFAGAGGELFCLDPATGELLWRNRLKGLGMGVVAFANSAEQVAQAAEAARQHAATAAVASS